MAASDTLLFSKTAELTAQGMPPARAMMLLVKMASETLSNSALHMAKEHAEQILDEWQVIRYAGESLELAATPDHRHIPGTEYNWRHDWHPLNVQTALLNRKKAAAKALFDKGAPFAAPERKSFYQSHPSYPKILPVNARVFSAPLHPAGPGTSGANLTPLGKVAKAAPAIHPDPADNKAVQAAALQKAVKTGKTQWVHPGTDGKLIVGEKAPTGVQKAISFHPNGVALVHAPNKAPIPVDATALRAITDKHLKMAGGPGGAPKVPRVKPPAAPKVRPPKAPNVPKKGPRPSAAPSSPAPGTPKVGGTPSTPRTGGAPSVPKAAGQPLGLDYEAAATKLGLSENYKPDVKKMSDWSAETKTPTALVGTSSGQADMKASLSGLHTQVSPYLAFDADGKITYHPGKALAWSAPGNLPPDYAKIKDKDLGEPPLPAGHVSAGILVREPDGRITIIKPKGGFGGYDHTIPKGSLEPGDGLSAQQSAHRELFEETGLKADITGFLGDYKGTTGTTRMYVATRKGGIPNPDDPTPYTAGGNEASKVLTLSPSEAEKLLNTPRDKQILADALKHPAFAGKPDLKPGITAGHSDEPTPLGGPFAPLDTKDWKFISGPQGSNSGGTYEAPDGTRYYVKHQKSDLHARNEVLGAQLYQLGGVATPNVSLARLPDGSLGTASKIIPDAKKDLAAKLSSSPDYKTKVQNGFAVDAWLGNWDTVGASHDNIVSNQAGIPVRVDTGGTMLFRAQGSLKGGYFNGSVKEFDTLRDSSKNPQAASAFAGMSDEALKASAERVAHISPAAIKAAVQDSGMEPDAAENLSKILIARRADIAKRAGITLPEGKQDVPTGGSLVTLKPTGDTEAAKAVTSTNIGADGPKLTLNDLAASLKAKDAKPAPVYKASEAMIKAKELATSTNYAHYAVKAPGSSSPNQWTVTKKAPEHGKFVRVGADGESSIVHATPDGAKRAAQSYAKSFGKPGYISVTKSGYSVMGKPPAEGPYVKVGSDGKATNFLSRPTGKFADAPATGTATRTATPTANGKLSKAGKLVVQAPTGTHKIGDKIKVTHPKTGETTTHEVTSVGHSFPVKGEMTRYHYVTPSAGAPKAAPVDDGAHLQPPKNSVDALVASAKSTQGAVFLKKNWGTDTGYGISTTQPDKGVPYLKADANGNVFSVDAKGGTLLKHSAMFKTAEDSKAPNVDPTAQGAYNTLKGMGDIPPNPDDAIQNKVSAAQAAIKTGKTHYLVVQTGALPTTTKPESGAYNTFEPNGQISKTIGGQTTALKPSHLKTYSDLAQSEGMEKLAPAPGAAKGFTNGSGDPVEPDLVNMLGDQGKLMGKSAFLVQDPSKISGFKLTYEMPTTDTKPFMMADKSGNVFTVEAGGKTTLTKSASGVMSSAPSAPTGALKVGQELSTSQLTNGQQVAYYAAKTSAANSGKSWYMNDAGTLLPTKSNPVTGSKATVEVQPDGTILSLGGAAGPIPAAPGYEKWVQAAKEAGPIDIQGQYQTIPAALQAAVNEQHPVYAKTVGMKALYDDPTRNTIKVNPDGTMEWHEVDGQSGPIAPDVVDSFLSKLSGLKAKPAPAAPKIKLKNPPVKAAKGLGPTNKAIHNSPAYDVDLSSVGSTPTMVQKAAIQQKAIQTGEKHYLYNSQVTTTPPSSDYTGIVGTFNPDGTTQIQHSGIGSYAYVASPSASKKLGIYGLKQTGNFNTPTTNAAKTGSAVPLGRHGADQTYKTNPHDVVASDSRAELSGKPYDEAMGEYSYGDEADILKGTPIERFFKGKTVPSESAVANDWKAHSTVTKTQENVINHYTGSYASDLNGKLRQGKGLTAYDKGQQAQMDAAAASYTTPQAIYVRRGLNAYGFPDEKLDGKIIQDAGNMSTSFGAGFSGHIRMRILVPKGSHGISVKGIGGGQHSNEKEFILPRGTQLFVHKDEVDEKTGYRNIVATVVPTVTPELIPEGQHKAAGAQVTGIVSPSKRVQAVGYSTAGLDYLKVYGRKAWLAKYSTAGSGG